MPRRRLILAHHPHHVMLRGNNRRRIFSYPREYELFLDCMARALKRTPLPIHALTLMKNHVHIIATPENPEVLSLFVKATSERYAAERNRARGASGKLFEQRFLSIPILSIEQLAITTAYVELNPVRSFQVSDPIDYPWSTYGLHAGQAWRSRISPTLWTPSAWYLELGVERYVEFVAEQQQRPERPKIVTYAEVIERKLTQPNARRFERPDRSSAL